MRSKPDVGVRRGSGKPPHKYCPLSARASGIALCAFLVFSTSLSAADSKSTPPEQPIPYSHKQHLALGLKCQDCHTNPDPGESMGIPAAAKCMACHITIAKDKPPIQKLASFAASKQPIPWVRVYQIPSYVDFSHRTHLEAGAKCENCHGPVAERDALWREGNISMGGCMDCHRRNKASIDCTYCHDAR
ncbi:MAG TPA: cytochrome c3 family protein [Bryobacteraceae bacterium]|nr:cytochrome c3 family protein [Bryobacteraceae bacterium]